jgi:hypothetical protein
LRNKDVDLRIRVGMSEMLKERNRQDKVTKEQCLGNENFHRAPLHPEILFISLIHGFAYGAL